MSVMLLLVTLMLTVPTLSALFSAAALQDILGTDSVVQVCHTNCKSFIARESSFLTVDTCNFL